MSKRKNKKAKKSRVDLFHMITKKQQKARSQRLQTYSYLHRKESIVICKHCGERRPINLIRLRAGLYECRICGKYTDTLFHPEQLRRDD